jgi:predicted DNA-binding ribbon-helix-helix protein
MDTRGNPAGAFDPLAAAKTMWAPSPVKKRSIVVSGHKTAVSLEDEFWGLLKYVARLQNKTLSTLVGEIDLDRTQGNLSSAIRLYILRHLINELAKAHMGGDDASVLRPTEECNSNRRAEESGGHP